MSLKLTTQNDWIKFASFSAHHPDNLQRKPDISLPPPVCGPPPSVQIGELDKKIKGAWGSKLCCEIAYGKNETRTWQKRAVTSKVGAHWGATTHAEKAKSQMTSGMYAGSLIEPSFEELIELGAVRR